MQVSMFKKAILVASLALPLTVLAQPVPAELPPDAIDMSPAQTEGHKPCHRHARHDGPGMHHMLRDLDLSETQREQIEQIMQAQSPKMREQAKVLRETRKAMRELARADALDEGQLQVLSAKLAESMSAMQADRIRTQHAVFALLTPEQRAEARETMTQRVKGHRHHGRHHDQRGHATDMEL
ncbi:MAG: Spy/CpxP family protein refolding chaperone [Pseudomonadota bacterium]